MAIFFHFVQRLTLEEEEGTENLVVDIPRRRSLSLSLFLAPGLAESHLFSSATRRCVEDERENSSNEVFSLSGKDLVDVVALIFFLFTIFIYFMCVSFLPSEISRPRERNGWNGFPFAPTPRTY